MKRIVLSLWLILLTTSLVSAQTDTEKQTKQLKNWALVKLTIAYIEDLRGFNSSEEAVLDQAKKEHAIEYKTYQELVNKYKTFDENIDIDIESVSTVLKEGDLKTIEEKVFKVYKKELDSNNSPAWVDVNFIPKTNKNDKDKNIQTSRELALNEIRRLIESQSDNRQLKEHENTAVYMVDPLTKNDASRAFTFAPTSLLILVLLIISLVLNFVQYNKSKKTGIKKGNEKVKEQSIITSNNDKSIKKNEEFEYLKRSNEELTKTNSELVNKNTTLELEAKKRADDVNAPRVDKGDISNIETQKQPFVQAIMPAQSRRVLYFPSPFDDLTFSDEDAKSELTTSSLYIVEVDEQTRIGTLSLIEKSDLSRALNSPRMFLERVCNYDNEHTDKAKGIMVLEKGKIRPVGDDWKVEKKVLIKFLY